jgi:hypothetical protein
MSVDPELPLTSPAGPGDFSQASQPEPSLRIDCHSCQVRGPACQDCLVTVLLGPPPEWGFDADEQHALAALAEGGLIPPLRMVCPVVEPEVESA